jgi:hypothetical protein
VQGLLRQSRQDKNPNPAKANGTGAKAPDDGVYNMGGGWAGTVPHSKGNQRATLGSERPSARRMCGRGPSKRPQDRD